MFSNGSSVERSFDSMQSHVALIKVSMRLSPWAILDRAWRSIKGYPADQFEFIEGRTALSTFTVTVTTIVLYYAIVFGGREWMRDRKPFKLNGLFMAHNFMLTFVSAALLLLFAEQLVPSIFRDGLYENICGADGWTKPLVTLYYLNYVVKYIELADTVFLFLKKKPLTFLHCYHHPATVLLCWTQLRGNTSVSWVPITLNLFVHVVMYWYYFQSARGKRVAWKEWITRLQITQFVLDLGFIYFATWDYYASTSFPWAPHIGTCAGEPFAAATGCVILSSYLVLFIMFYLATYKKDSKKSRVKQTHAQTAVLDMEKTDVADMTETVVNATNVVLTQVNPDTSKVIGK